MIKAVIFDLDGTIAETLPLCIAAFKRSIEPLAGREFSREEIVSTFGPSEEGTIQELIPDFYDEGLAAFLKYYEEMHEMCPRPFDGMKELVSWLKSQGIVVAMVTGKGRASCDISLEYYGMGGLFDMVETGSPHGSRKVEGIRSVLDQFGLKPEDAIYVGDAVTDIYACREVHVPIVSAAWSEDVAADKLRELQPDELFSSVEEFQRYLKVLLDSFS